VLNRGHDYRERIGAEAAERPLLDWLVERYPHSSRETWRQRILRGRVLLDARPAPPERLLRAGQCLTWRRPPWREPEAPRSFAVLYEDEDLLAVAKPAGLPTLPGAGFLQTTLLHRVRRVAPDATPLHRLGRFTSGVVLFARGREARARLSRLWSSSAVSKRYRALASGRPAEPRFEIDTPIGPVPHPLLGTVHAACPDGRPARSHVEVVEQRDDGFLCDVRIETGRPHQIRIHLAAAGHPLVGDPLYASEGLPAPGCHALPGEPGYRLHASELGFPHPRSGEPIRVECAPPLELRAATQSRSSR
jgi:23S rRNA pseudouridine1911/1915/1917 synthase